MEALGLLFVKLMILFVGRSSAEYCDRATTAQARAGNLGQSGDFNWLGILHVELHDVDKIRVAMTGVVLIKIKHALANADDMVRIPQPIFKSDSKIMFLAARDTSWSVKPKSYVTHPEYEYSTLNTIAIVELNLEDSDDFPLNPICIPTGEIFNTSRYLYITGYTDENKKMEKVIYNIQHLDKKVCDEFYNRAGLSSQKRIPSAYLCGYTPSNVTQCVWDNGMALVSNVTGYFQLIGFGIHGPGCAAPARFIDLFSYFSWINSVTSPDMFYDDAGYRRKEDLARVVVDRVHKADDEFLPIHELFTLNGSRRAWVKGKGDIMKALYNFHMEPLEHFKIIPTKDNKNVVLVVPFNETWEKHEKDCENFNKVLMYKESFKLNAERKQGNAIYKLSLYDMEQTECSCVRITVYSDSHSETILSFKERLNYKDDQITDAYKTPKDIIISYLKKKRPEEPRHWLDILGRPKPEKTSKPLTSYDHLEPTFIEDDDIYFKEVLNYDLYIQFQFTDQAILQFEIFAEPRSFEIFATETTTPKGRRANSKVQTTAKSDWSMVNSNMLKEAKVSLMADVHEVQETESAACSEGTPGAVVVACWLVSACLRRAFFIH